jgi:hypothetical protein
MTTNLLSRLLDCLISRNIVFEMSNHISRLSQRLHSLLSVDDRMIVIMYFDLAFCTWTNKKCSH